MTEQEYKDYIYKKANDIKTKEDLDNMLTEVVNDKELDYGKLCYAISGCMLAALNYVNNSEVGGITGFQASIIGWQMVRKLICDNDTSLRLIDYDNMLYPQYECDFDKVIDETTWKLLQEKAKEKLERVTDAHPNVIKHWQSIVDGEIPFGYNIK